MGNIIPREKIRHLEWTSEMNPPEITLPNTSRQIADQINVTIEEILNGREFYSEDKDSDGKYIGAQKALQETLDYIGTEGFIVSIPELIAAKVTAPKTHNLWKQWYTAHTEENIGIDTKGKFYNRDEPVLVVVHGGGLLTPERINRAYSEGLVGHSAKYTQEEFDNLLEGIVANGEVIQLFKYDDMLEKEDLPHRFGVVMKYDIAQSTKSGYHKRITFTENPLVIARAGGIGHLKDYHDLAKDFDEEVRNSHVYEGRDPQQPSGRLLCLGYGNDGLFGDDLDSSGRFIGVAPEAQSAKKIIGVIK